MSPDAASVDLGRTLSVVAPCFNEEEVLPLFIARAQAVCEAQAMPYEIVLIDDGSFDATWPIICACAANDPRIVGIRLRRNHGHQIALTSGVAAARGDLLLLIDADLQDPPELLPQMVAAMDQHGADVVYGRRRKRAGESALKLATAAAFYRLINALSEVEIPSDTGDFRLITRHVAQLLSQMPEQHRFIRGMVAWIGGVQVPLLYDRDVRHAGISKYPYRKMVRFANDALTSFSRRPLQIATSVGLVSAGLSALLGLMSIVRFFMGMTVPGWASLMTVLGVFFALQFFMLGIMGEYIGRLYEQSRQRPLFLEAERSGTGLADQPTNKS